MGDKFREITEDTVLPISLILSLIAGAFWISGVSSRADTATTMAAECSQDFKRIDERLSRIEGKLGIHP